MILLSQILKRKVKKIPSPFITSSLQTEAYKECLPKKCMMVAQKLYEGGHITYENRFYGYCRRCSRTNQKSVITKLEKEYNVVDYGNKKRSRHTNVVVLLMRPFQKI